MAFWSKANKTAEPPVRGLRALVIADTRPNLRGRGIDEVVAEQGLGLVITAGDLHQSDLPGINAVDVPVVGVYGNHCNGRYFDDLGIINLHLSRIDVAGVSFAGVQGCVRYKDGSRDLLYTQGEYAAMINRLPAANVLVTHCPPAGVNDHPSDPAHVGIDALRRWIDTKAPRVLIHGHTYPRPAITRCGSTRVEYVRGARIIEL